MMNYYVQRLQGCMQSIGQGWWKQWTVLALGAAFAFGIMAPASGSAAGNGITQIEFLRWMVQLSGDNNQFNGNSSDADYVNWAKVKGMNPSSGWNPQAVLTRDALAQALVQLLRLNPRQYGGDFVRILAREGIVLSANNNVSRADFVSLIDQDAFLPQLPSQLQPTSSPYKRPNNGLGNGKQPPPPHNPNGDPHETRPGNSGNAPGHNK